MSFFEGKKDLRENTSCQMLMSQTSQVTSVNTIIVIIHLIPKPMFRQYS